MTTKQTFSRLMSVVRNLQAELRQELADVRNKNRHIEDRCKLLEARHTEAQPALRVNRRA